MHIDRWVKVGVLATVLSTGFEARNAYRGEFPKRPLPEQKSPEKTGDPVTDPSPYRFWIAISPSVISTLLLGAALLVASRRTNSADGPRLVIHRAHFQVWGSWFKPKEDYTEAVAAIVKHDSLDFLPSERFGDPFPNKLKRFVVIYSIDGIRHKISRANGERISIGGPLSPSQNTRAPNKAIPVIGVVLRLAVVEPYDTAPGRHYPRKLRMYCSNEGDEIVLGEAKWIGDGIGIEKDKPPACAYEIKDHLGGWFGESPRKLIPSGKWFRLYVGIDSSVPEDRVQELAREHRLGVLQIPARVNGSDVVFNMCP